MSLKYSLNKGFKFRYFQEEAIEAVIEATEKKKQNPLIALPTGSGKSNVIGGLISYGRTNNLSYKVLVLVHTQDLVSGNYETYKKNFVDNFDNVGVFSAGMNKKEWDKEVIFASIQSYTNVSDYRLQRFDMVIIDEAHRCPDEGLGQYRTLLKRLKNKNKNMFIVGTSATAFRVGLGCLSNGDIFDGVCYEKTIEEMISEGFLTTPYNKVSINNSIDTSILKTVRGEYDEAQQYSQVKDDKNESIVKDLLHLIDIENRKSIVIFCINIEHANKVSEELKKQGESGVELLTSKCSSDRKGIISRMRSGESKWLVNVDMATTGVDIPRLDTCVLLRAMRSPILYIQMVGRVLRLFDGKDKSLILDYGQNIKRIGSINNIRITEAKKDSRGKVKLGITRKRLERQCIICGETFQYKLERCPVCGEEDPKVSKILKDCELWSNPEVALDILSGLSNVAGSSKVVKIVEFSKHYSKKEKTRAMNEFVNCQDESIKDFDDYLQRYGKHCLRIDYKLHRGYTVARQYFVPNGRGFAKQKFDEWWNRVVDPRYSHKMPPMNFSSAVSRQNEILPVKGVLVKKNDAGFDEIIDYRF